MNKTRRTVFLSSADGLPNSEIFDFTINMSSVLAHAEEHDTSNEGLALKNKTSVINASVEQLYIPLKKGTQAHVPREPEVLVTVRNTTTPPPVHMLRLHCDATHDNLQASGNSNIILQIPFMNNYREAESIPASSSSEVNFNNSSVSYTSNHSEQQGMFRLVHGYKGLDTVRFWLTDEKNRLIKPNLSNSNVYLALTLTTESNIAEVKRHRDIMRMLLENAHLTRMLVIQNHDSRESLRYLKRHNEHKDRLHRKLLKHIDQ